jgi:transketolase
MREGKDLTIIACGVCVLQAVRAAKVLAEKGLDVRVVNMHTVKPIDKEAVMKAVTETRRIVTVEEHNVECGLGSAVADVIAESGKACAFTKLGIPDIFAIVGYPEDLYNYYKIDSDGIVNAVSALMGKEIEEDEDWSDET